MSNTNNTSQGYQTAPGIRRTHHGEMQTDSNDILRAVLAGDYNLALRYACESSSHSPLSPTIQEKLVRIFTDHIEIQYEFQKRQEPLTTISDLDAVVDRFEAVLYDMGDVADEYNDKNTRIYLTIMAERLVTMAKSFNNEHINNRMTISMPSSLVNKASRVNLLNQLFFQGS
ncbi:hypothetical protein Unana1_07758 [Umbelopsis nana]